MNRCEKAVENHKKGYNCAQAVACVFADKLGYSEDEPDLVNSLRFLREREIVCSRKFGEALDRLQSKMCEKNKFYMNK